MSFTIDAGRSTAPISWPKPVLLFNVSRIALLVNGLPFNGLGGGALTAVNVGLALRRRGHEVVVLALLSVADTSKIEENLRVAEKMDLSLRLISSSAARPSYPIRAFTRRLQIFLKPEGALKPANRLVTELDSELEQLGPDAVLAYHWESVAAIPSRWRRISVALVGDPIHRAKSFRREWESRYPGATGDSSVLKLLRSRYFGSQNRRVLRFQVEQLKSCRIAGAFAAHHAAELEAEGASCAYIRTPIDAPASRWVGENNRPGEFSILLMGHLRGVATMTGIESLVDNIIPTLESRLPDGFNLKIAGGYFETLPTLLRERLEKHDRVHVLGHVENPSKILSSVGLLLVPTPIPLGIRVRILTGLSFGVPVVAHQANALGIPELLDGYNCLMGENGVELAHKCVELAQNPRLARQIGAQGRKTFRQYFSLERAGAQLDRFVFENLSD